MHLAQIFYHFMGDKEQSGDYITWLLNNTVQCYKEWIETVENSFMEQYRRCPRGCIF